MYFFFHLHIWSFQNSLGLESLWILIMKLQTKIVFNVKEATFCQALWLIP